MGHFPTKVLVLKKYGAFVAQNMALDNLESGYFNPTVINITHFITHALYILYNVYTVHG